MDVEITKNDVIRERMTLVIYSFEFMMKATNHHFRNVNIHRYFLVMEQSVLTYGSISMLGEH